MGASKRLGIMLVVVIVAAACGGDGDGDDSFGSGRDLDVCSLVTGAEAEKWLKGPANPPTPTQNPGGGDDDETCIYRSDEARTEILLQARDGRVYFAELGSPAREGRATLEGLGEDAHVGVRSVRFTQNNWSVSVGTIQGLIENEQLIEMAQLVSSRLP